MSVTIGVAILGGTGYGAGELLRLLVAHPGAHIVSVVSSSSAHVPVADVHTHLRGLLDLRFTSAIDLDKLATYDHRFVFTSLPHGKSAEVIAELAASREFDGVCFIDLGGDFRLQDLSLHSRFYPESAPAAELRKRSVYGLPELYREEIRKGSLIANPGCFATACILSVLPLIKEGYAGQIVFHAMSGSSGAGRKAQPLFHHPELHANAFAYKVLEHRHEPEIRQAFGDIDGNRLQIVFVPHVIPVSRGILVSAALMAEQEVRTEELLARFRSFYRQERFIRITDDPPLLTNVVGSNFCDISVRARGPQVICLAALDNLVKGMAGQALQNMNLIAGVSEQTGLLQAAPRLI